MPKNLSSGLKATFRREWKRRPPPPAYFAPQVNGGAMTDWDWKIALVTRTIGAERGMAARGRP